MFYLLFTGARRGPRRRQTTAQDRTPTVGYLGQALGVRVVQAKLPGAPVELEVE